MKDVLIFQNDKNISLITNGLISKMQKEYRIHCICESSIIDIYKSKRNIFTEYYHKNIITSYDLLINFSLDKKYLELSEGVKAKKKLGFGYKNGKTYFYSKGAKNYYDVMYNSKKTSSNIFQLCYGIADIQWRGEGYGINNFYPKKTNILGIFIENIYWREYIKNNLNCKSEEIKIKHGMNNQLNEINNFDTIVTDNIEIYHFSLSLRKKVEFLTNKDLNYKLETFGSANIHRMSNG